MKKIISVMFFLLLVPVCLSACAAGDTGNADLAAFYDSLAAEYELPAMTDADDTVLASYYPGLDAVSLSQCVVKLPEMSSVAYEFVFVECENREDADTAAGILQARIDEQVSGGAWYPMTIKSWEKAKVVVSGNYVAMIAADDDTESIVSGWNELFD